MLRIALRIDQVDERAGERNAELERDVVMPSLKIRERGITGSGPARTES